MTAGEHFNESSSYAAGIVIRVASILLIAVLSVGLAGCNISRLAEPTKPPNIVLVIGDDHGWPNFGFMGDPIVQTPHIDELAERSAVFPYGFTHGSVCRPALMSLLTGLYTDQWESKNAYLRQKGIMHLNHMREMREIVFYRTLPRELNKVGYASFQGGKHWEGLYHEAGFTTGTKVQRGETILDWRRHSGDDADFGRESIQPAFDFVDSLDDQPFFMWFAPKLPHLPHDAGDEYRSLYEGKGLSRTAVNYYANISRLDARLGELTDYLERKNILNDTLLIFLSDNGWEIDATGSESSHELSGGAKGKSSARELGFRTPVLVSWPGHIQPMRSDQLVLGVDVFATILDYSGATAMSDRLGISLRPQLEGHEGVIRPYVADKFSARPALGPLDTVPLGGQDTTRFVRTKQWRYTHSEKTNREELYRIDEDPYETKNVIADNASTAKLLRTYLSDWLDDLRLPNGTYELDGVLRDTTTGTPVVGVQVVLRGTGASGQRFVFEASSNTAGLFEFVDLPAGEFTLSSKLDDYQFSDLNNGRPNVRVSLPQGTLGGYVRVGVVRKSGISDERDCAP